MKLGKKTAAFHLVLFLWIALLVCRCQGFTVTRVNTTIVGKTENVDGDNFLIESHGVTLEVENQTTAPVCRLVENAMVDIDTAETFPTLKFNATWISRKYFWLSEDFNFERRYQQNVEDVLRTQKVVKVFILPHSHNDPGWLNTYEQYYYRQTKYILDNVVDKLTALPKMTFVWSEITYLAKWWKEASPLARQRFRKLVVDEGRLEIGTGGWVVPDEATSSLYTLLSELTEGQQWVKTHLNTTAQYSWAIDPFGHSATHSHLLKSAGMKGMVIQRLHYVWKHWLAEHKSEEFRWRPRWDTEGHQDIPCFTLPYDLYSIKHACGPEPQVCLKFDFRNIQYEYGENYGIMTPITKSTIRQSAQELVKQYHKTASLTKHNVLLVPLGDDFRYDRPLEWEQQYANYMQLFSYINANVEKFGMEIQFGTLRDYFEAVEKQEDHEDRPSFSGDFYPYGDVYVSGQPAYWTGFYGTRPYWKKFHREVENELRSAEILFTYAHMLAQKFNAIVEKHILRYKYQDLITARHDFSLFAHHDGITGTSRTWTMDDYGDRLHTAYQKCLAVQQQCLKIIYQMRSTKKTIPPALSKDFLRERFQNLPLKMPLEVFGPQDEYATKLMIFNNLGWKRTEVVKVLVKNVNVQVLDSQGAPVASQINPVLNHDEKTNTIEISKRLYELVFLANLEALATTVFKITEAPVPTEGDDFSGSNKMAVIACENCVTVNDSVFSMAEKFTQDHLTLKDSQMELYFQNNGLLDRVVQRQENTSVPVRMSFGLYKPTNRLSGAYLLKPILSSEWKFFQHLNDSRPSLIHISGPVISQLISIHHARYETIKVNTTLVNTTTVPEDFAAPQGILVETYVDFTRDYSHRAEVYMRLDSVLSNSTLPGINGTEDDDLVMYTDQNGFVCEKRRTISAIGYEGNTFPVTTTAFIQDDQEESMRLSVLVDRTHGFCSLEKGRLETLIERKSLYDDGRGMSEGVTNSLPTVSNYVLLLERLVGSQEEGIPRHESFSDWQPTLKAQQASIRLNYPPNLFVFTEPNENEAGTVEENTITLISTPLPENSHLLNFRVLSQKVDDDVRNGHARRLSRSSNESNDEIAGRTALLNLQHLWSFGTEMRKELCINNNNATTLDNRNSTTEMGGDDKPFFKTSAFLEQQHKDASLPGTMGFQMNYINATRIVRTSLTGVMEMSKEVFDERGDVFEETVTRSSILVNFKLQF